jgi:hypothetical protein
MKRTVALPLSVALLLLTAHRLPAPISEVPEPRATTPPKAKTKPPSSAKQKAPAEKEAKMADQSIRVLFSPGTQAALEYLKTKKDELDVKPNEIIERLRQVLSSRFSSVSIADDSSGKGRTGQVMVFDLQAQVAGGWAFQKNTVSFVATFKNGSGKTIQTISASGSSTVPMMPVRTYFPEAVAAAFADFSQKLGSGNRP